MATSGTKYALLLLPTWSMQDREEGTRQLARDLTTWLGKLEDLVDVEEVRHWKEWLGELEWDLHLEKSRLVFASMQSERPEILDAENQQLRMRAAIAWYGLLLAGSVRPFSGRAHCIGGQASSVVPQVRLHSVREQGDLGKVERPFYDTRPAFLHVMPWRDPDAWFERWAHWTTVLDNVFSAGVPPILDVALFAFRTALSRKRLEFSIPEYVRTIECVLAVPRNGGARVFTERALQIAPALASHWYVGGGDLRDRINALYQHRSDCVHGKVPFLTLAAKGDAGKDEAACLEFLAEALAREALRLAFASNQHHALFNDRATLEQAWQAKQFP